MQKLMFLARVTLLCNLVFLITLFLHLIPALENGVITSTILVLGNILAIVFNVLFHIILFIIMLMQKSFSTGVPAWIVVVNFLFLLVQVILLVK